jgi:hypothetical protein
MIVFIWLICVFPLKDVTPVMFILLTQHLAQCLAGSSANSWEWLTLIRAVHSVSGAMRGALDI